MTQPTQNADRPTTAKRPFVAPVIERHEKLPEITFMILSVPGGVPE